MIKCQREIAQASDHTHAYGEQQAGEVEQRLHGCLWSAFTGSQKAIKRIQTNTSMIERFLSLSSVVLTRSQSKRLRSRRGGSSEKKCAAVRCSALRDSGL